MGRRRVGGQKEKGWGGRKAFRSRKEGKEEEEMGLGGGGEGGRRRGDGGLTWKEFGGAVKEGARRGRITSSCSSSLSSSLTTGLAREPRLARRRPFSRS